jgi:hypothetical protein
MSITMYAGRIYDAVVIAGGGLATAVATPIRMDGAVSMSIHTQVATTTGGIDVTYTYDLSSNIDGPWAAGSVTIADHTALVVVDFVPEASKYIRMTVTNNDAAAVTLTTVLNMQEGG